MGPLLCLCSMQNRSLVGIVIYVHIEGALYAQKSVPSWFLAVFTPKLTCVEI